MDLLYDSVSLLKAVEKIETPKTFLEDFFGVDGEVVEDEVAIWDKKKSTIKMAPMVPNGAGGVLMERDGFETDRIEFCTIAPERLVEVAQLNKRAFGEAILGGMNPEQRAKKMMAKDIVEMKAAIARRKGWMFLQVLLTGKLEIFTYTNEGRGKRPSMVADFGFQNNYVPETAWGQAGAKILDDMQAIDDLVYDGQGVVEAYVMAPDVASVILHNEEYMKHMDRRNEEAGKINLKYRGQGVRYIGTNADGVDMFSFSGKYLDDDGLLKPILPSGTLIAGGRGILRMPYTAVTQVEGVNSDPKTYVKKEVPLHYSSIDANATKNRLTSRPVVLPENIDGWAVAQVL